MENLQEQISQVTRDFIATVQSLTAQHAGAVLQETFSSLGGTPGGGVASSTAARPRGAKRGADELEQLSKRFVQFVHDTPGQRIEQINKQLGTTTAELALPIRKLLSEGTITSEGQKRSTIYFAGKGAAAAAPSDEGEGKGAPSTRKSGKKRARAASKKNRSRSKKK
jgi:hypothetical protein